MRLALVAAFLFLMAFPVQAQETGSYVTTGLAKVIAITAEEERPVPGTGVTSIFQTLRAEILEGPEQGKVVTVENDYLSLAVGDRFYVEHRFDPFLDEDRYTVSEPYRLDILAALVGLFVLCAVAIGGRQGIRGLIALTISFLFIGYLLLPGILAGWDPLLVSFGVASLIIILGSYVTHGFNRVTTAAVAGMIATIGVTALLSYISIRAARLSGFTSDEAVYLNLNTAGSIDFTGLLLGAMLIGILGVLYDAAIGQAVSVDELVQAARTASRRHIFSRAMRIGREHIGALVNTLAIAYVGVALPLLLLFSSLNSDSSLLVTLNRELFAEEVIRMTVGSIGIMLAVPLTTLVAVFMLKKPLEPPL